MSIRACLSLGPLWSVTVHWGALGSIWVHRGGGWGSVLVCLGLSKFIGVCQDLSGSISVRKGLWGAYQGVSGSVWVKVCLGISGSLGVFWGSLGSVRVH